MPRVGEQTSRRWGACSNFLLRFPSNLITEPNGVCELMDRSATVFVEEVSIFFSTFSVIVLMLGRCVQAKIDADTLLHRFCHTLQKKWNTKSKNNCVKRCLVTTLCHLADRCNRLVEVWPWPPLSSSFKEEVTTITVRELSDNTSLIRILNGISFWT
jgi:hypothetical protein